MNKFADIVPFLTDQFAWIVYIVLISIFTLFLFIYWPSNTVLRLIHFNKIPKWLQGFIKILFGCLALYSLSNIVFLKSSPHELKIVDFLAILGTILAVVSWREAVQQNEEVNEILTSLPTRYVGLFPDHLGEIIKLVDRARTKFCIMADCVDYGSFSNPELHKRMLQAMEEALIRGVEIQILICGPAQAISRHSQFREKWQGPWSKLYADPKFKACLKKYLKLNPDFIPNLTLTAEEACKKDFDDMLLRHHKCIVDCLRYKSAKTFELECSDENIPGIFFWMEDDVEAVFLLSHTDATTRGLAFQTRDTKLVEIFKSSFNLKLKEWKRQQVEKKQAVTKPGEI